MQDKTDSHGKVLTTVPNEKEWKEFMDSGLLWFINRQLHIFGWCICVTVNEDSNGKRILSVNPMKTDFRGFTMSLELEGFRKLTKYMKENSNKLNQIMNE